jgi:hypothetical protein
MSYLDNICPFSLLSFVFSSLLRLGLGNCELGPQAATGS